MYVQKHACLLGIYTPLALPLAGTVQRKTTHVKAKCNKKKRGKEKTVIFRFCTKFALCFFSVVPHF